MTIKIANVSEERWRYESLCSHIGEGQTEFEQAATMRRTWLERLAREPNLTTRARASCSNRIPNIDNRFSTCVSSRVLMMITALQF